MDKFLKTMRLASNLIGLLTPLLLACSGCARFSYDMHHLAREINDALGRDLWCYYHSPVTGQIVPKHQPHCCPGMAEPPFFGYQGTCWRKWPEGWVACPIIEEEAVPAEPTGRGAAVVPPRREVQAGGTLPRPEPAVSGPVRAPADGRDRKNAHRLPGGPTEQTARRPAPRLDRILPRQAPRSASPAAVAVAAQEDAAKDPAGTEAVSCEARPSSLLKVLRETVERKNSERLGRRGPAASNLPSAAGDQPAPPRGGPDTAREAEKAPPPSAAEEPAKSDRRVKCSAFSPKGSAVRVDAAAPASAPNSCTPRLLKLLQPAGKLPPLIAQILYEDPDLAEAPSNDRPALCPAPDEPPAQVAAVCFHRPVVQYVRR